MIALDILLAITVVLVALGSLTVREPFSAVVLFIVYGVMIALCWVRFHAPDVALAEAAIGAGITGALLLEAVASARRGHIGGRGESINHDADT